ncbi:hypothetical protein [Streptomyces sp. NPDC055607]
MARMTLIYRASNDRLACIEFDTTKSPKDVRRDIHRAIAQDTNCTVRDTDGITHTIPGGAIRSVELGSA